MVEPFLRRSFERKKDMLHQSNGPEEGNHLYQRKLAAALVASLGFDAALETCQRNGWEGVLSMLSTKRQVPGNARSR